MQRGWLGCCNIFIYAAAQGLPASRRRCYCALSPPRPGSSTLWATSFSNPITHLPVTSDLAFLCPCRVEIRDIATSSAWEAAYSMEVPVLVRAEMDGSNEVRCFSCY